MTSNLSDAEVIEYMHRFFDYNQDGTFTRRDRKGGNGSLDKDGYLIIKIKGKQYKAHRLVFAYFNNRFPTEEIDHINRNRTDNRIENLRECTRLENMQNYQVPPNPQTGARGVHITNTKGLKKKYTTRYQRKTYRFYTVEEAVEWRKNVGINI